MNANMNMKDIERYAAAQIMLISWVQNSSHYITSNDIQYFSPIKSSKKTPARFHVPRVQFDDFNAKSQGIPKNLQQQVDTGRSCKH